MGLGVGLVVFLGWLGVRLVTGAGLVGVGLSVVEGGGLFAGALLVGGLGEVGVVGECISL